MAAIPDAVVSAKEIARRQTNPVIKDEEKLNKEALTIRATGGGLKGQCEDMNGDVKPYPQEQQTPSPTHVENYPSHNISKHIHIL